MAGRPRPRGDADRERVIGLLREHFARAAGRGPFDRRIGVVLAAEFADEAAGAWTGAGAGPPRPPGRSRRGRRGHGQAARPEPGWVPTQERFRDPTSKVIMRSARPRDESRHYIPSRELTGPAR